MDGRRVSNFTLARLAFENGFQCFGSALEWHKPKSVAPYRFRLWEDFAKDDTQHILYAAAYGTAPSRGTTLLNVPHLRGRIRRVAELMGGSSELSIYTAPSFPDIRFISVDIDPSVVYYSRRRMECISGSAHAVCLDLRKLPKQDGTLAFIGKESLNYFPPTEIRPLLQHLVDNYTSVAIETLRTPRSFGPYWYEHPIDWLPPSYHLVERYSSNVEGRMKENAALSQLAMSLYLEKWGPGRTLRDYWIVSNYDWTYYSHQQLILMLLDIGLTADQIRLVHGKVAMPISMLGPEHSHLFTGPGVVTLMFGR